MPNLVVYVPAALWADLEKMGLDYPKVEARKVAIGALERYVTGIGEPITTDVPEEIIAITSPPGFDKTRREPPPAAPEREFKPDWKPRRK